MRPELATLWRDIKSRGGKSYVYVISFRDGTPFYVGVGTKRRILLHERPPAINQSNPKAAKIRDLLAAGTPPIYSIAGWFETWDLAAEEERRLIAHYGRADLERGPLLNRTNGGQGAAGLKWLVSPSRLQGICRAAEKNRGRKHTEEHKAKIGAAMAGHVWRPETLARRAAALTGRTLTSDHRAKLSAAKLGKAPANTGKPRSLEARARMSAARKGQKPSPETLAGGAAWRAENAALISAKRKALWADPAYRAMMIASRHGRNKEIGQ